jgi:hypothetical protein
MPCPRRYKEMESVVVQALHYINNDRGYTMWDIHY